MLLYWTVDFPADSGCCMPGNCNQLQHLYGPKQGGQQQTLKFPANTKAAEAHSSASTAGKEHDFCLLSTFQNNTGMHFIHTI